MADWKYPLFFVKPTIKYDISFISGRKIDDNMRKDSNDNENKDIVKRNYRAKIYFRT